MSETPQYTYGSKPASHQPYQPSPDRPPSQYWVRFRERVSQWREKNLEQYLEMERDARAQCELSLTLPLNTAKQMVVDAIVAEKIRVLRGWPDQITWENEGKI